MKGNCIISKGNQETGLSRLVESGQHRLRQRDGEAKIRGTTMMQVGHSKRGICLL